MGWVAQTLLGNQAITEVTQTKERAYKGCGSLKAKVDLIPGDPNKNDGETLVDLIKNPPSGVITPVNMAGKTITCRIWAPKGALGSGARNFIQVFVKDSKFIGYYGPDRDIQEEKWFEVSVTIPSEKVATTGFDPTDIVLVGVKIGARVGATGSFNGFIYIDVYDWK